MSGSNNTPKTKFADRDPLLGDYIWNYFSDITERGEFKGNNFANAIKSNREPIFLDWGIFYYGVDNYLCELMVDTINRTMRSHNIVDFDTNGKVNEDDNDEFVCRIKFSLKDEEKYTDQNTYSLKKIHESGDNRLFGAQYKGEHMGNIGSIYLMESPKENDISNLPHYITNTIYGKPNASDDSVCQKYADTIENTMKSNGIINFSIPWNKKYNNNNQVLVCEPHIIFTNDTK